MICPKCQNEIAEGSKFCSNCGNSLQVEQENVNVKIAIILLSVFLAPFSILALIILVVNKTLKKETTFSFKEYINYFRKSIGWFFAFMFFVLLFSEKNPLCVFFMILLVSLLCPYISNLIEKKTNFKNYGKTKAITVAVLVVLCAAISGNSEDNKQDASQVTSSEVVTENKTAVKENVNIDKPKTKPAKKKSEYKAPIEEGALWTIPTQYGKGYDKTLKKHGIDNVKRSNELLPKAAELVSRNTACDKITNVMFSDNSTKDNIIIITDCQNGKRFNLTEKEIVSNSTAKSEYEKLESLITTHVAMCEARIKNSLNYPSTYKKLISKTGWETEDYVNDIVIGFKAKNAFNLETEYTARCMLNSKNEFSTFSIKEKR